jgi:hypothetical protein
VGTPPANLLSVGVVETSRPAPEPIFMESVPGLPLTGEDALHEPEPRARSARKRGGDDAKPRRTRKSAPSSAEEDDTPSPRRAPRKSRSKTVSE